MKDETIRPGDLVRVVSGMRCCGKSTERSKPGSVFYVVKVKLLNNRAYRCMHCHAPDVSELCARPAGWDSWIGVSRLKKIHPPELPETVEDRQEVEA